MLPLAPSLPSLALPSYPYPLPLTRYDFPSPWWDNISKDAKDLVKPRSYSPCPLLSS